MANEEHLKILKQGVEVWNRWRNEQPIIRPDLRKANLMGADLMEIDFKGAILYNANLDGAYLNDSILLAAYLNKANLSSAVLTGANLMLAQLKQGNLCYAKLTNTSLIGADLTEAIMWDTVLIRTHLSGANLKDASLGWTTLSNVNLSTVKALETVNHEGPSTIGIDTIYKSKGEIPEVFLRGAGLPDDFITYMKSLVGKPIEFYSCFISYSSKDEECAKRLHADLQDKGVRCWFAPEDLKIGEKIRPGIDDAIRMHDKLLLLLSENSIESEWVEDEVESAFEKEAKENKTVLFPIRLDDAVMETNKAWAAKIRRSRHIGNFSEWKNHDSYQKAFERLLRDLKAENSLEQ